MGPTGDNTKQNTFLEISLGLRSKNVPERNAFYNATSKQKCEEVATTCHTREVAITVPSDWFRNLEAWFGVAQIDTSASPFPHLIRPGTRKRTEVPRHPWWHPAVKKKTRCPEPERENTNKLCTRLCMNKTCDTL